MYRSLRFGGGVIREHGANVTAHCIGNRRRNTAFSYFSPNWPLLRQFSIQCIRLLRRIRKTNLLPTKEGVSSNVHGTGRRDVGANMWNSPIQKLNEIR